MSKRGIASAVVMVDKVEVTPAEFEAMFATGCDHSTIVTHGEGLAPSHYSCKRCATEWTPKEFFAARKNDWWYVVEKGE